MVVQRYSDVVPGSAPFQSLPVIAVKQRVSLNHEKNELQSRIQFLCSSTVQYSVQTVMQIWFLEIQ